MRLRQEYLNWIKERKKFFNTFPDTESLLDATENLNIDDNQENVDLLIRPQDDDDTQSVQTHETTNDAFGTNSILTKNSEFELKYHTSNYGVVDKQNVLVSLQDLSYPIENKGLEFHADENDTIKITDDADIRNTIKAMKDHAENTYPDGQMDILYGKDLLKAQKVANKVYIKVIRRNKRTAYADFTSHIKNTEEMARFAKATLNTGSRFKLGNLKNPDGTITNDQKETINTLVNHYFP